VRGKKSFTSNCISSLSSRAGEIKMVCPKLPIYLFQMIGLCSVKNWRVDLLYSNNWNFACQKYAI
jgi:hypothetical protein